jgi:hypothetical protein
MARPDNSMAGKDLLAKLQARRRKLSAVDRAEDNWRRSNLLARPMPCLKRLLDRGSCDPAAGVRKRR